MRETLQQQVIRLRQQVFREQLRAKRRDEQLEQAFEANRRLQKENARLEVRIADLEMKVRRDSSNSSQPPSSDKPWDKEARRKARNERKAKKQGKKKDKGGARKGRKGHRREQLPPDEVVEHTPSTCAACGGSLTEARPERSGRRQVTDLKDNLPWVVEHRRYAKRCLSCKHRTRAKYPAAVVATGGFGPTLRALMAAFRGAYGMSLRRGRQLLREVFRIRLSHGAMSKNERRMSEALVGHHAMVDDFLTRGSRLWADETTWSQDFELFWLWCKSDGRVRFYRIFERRNTEAAREFIGDFAGLLTTDDFGSYNFYAALKRQLCLGHLHRNIKGLGLHDDMAEWARKVDDELTETFRTWNRIRDGTEPRRKRRVLMRPHQDALKKLFEEGLSHDQKKVRGKCRRVLNRWEQWWRFVVQEAEPTNNEAERSLRGAVIFRKLSHGSRSERGSRFFERIMTVVETLRGCGEDVVGFLTRVMTRRAEGKSQPLLPLAA